MFTAARLQEMTDHAARITLEMLFAIVRRGSNIWLLNVVMTRRERLNLTSALSACGAAVASRGNDAHDGAGQKLPREMRWITPECEARLLASEIASLVLPVHGRNRSVIGRTLGTATRTGLEWWCSRDQTYDKLIKSYRSGLLNHCIKGTSHPINLPLL